MALTWLERTDSPRKGLIAVEKAGLLYNLFTTCLLLCLASQMDHPGEMLLGRAAIVAGTAVLWGLYRLRPCRLTLFLRMAFQLALLAYWYPDTYEFNRLFPNLDHLFATWEQQLFHCQPALLFARRLPSLWWSEAFNLGYFSYYPMIFGVALFYFLFRYRQSERAVFVLVTSFFLYYLVYIFLPVAGPQYYFPAVGMEEVAAGHFPAAGDFFRYHTELAPLPGQEAGLFSRLVEASQQAGERPTAAFPSSHVGISTILLMLAWRAKRLLFLLLLPFYVLLCCATVYIQAHYLVDALAGFVSAFLFYGLSVWLYERWFCPV